MCDRITVMQETDRRHVAIHFLVGSKEGVSKRYEEGALNERFLKRLVEQPGARWPEGLVIRTWV